EGVSPVLATGAGVAGGCLAGSVTGVLHTRFGINGLLAGILVTTALYSVNLHVMGKSNLPLLSATTLATWAEAAGASVSSGASVEVLGRTVNVRDASMFCLALAVAGGVAVLLYAFLRTDLGTALRAAGNNDQMTRALGVDARGMVVLGLALSNGLVA